MDPDEVLDELRAMAHVDWNEDIESDWSKQTANERCLLYAERLMDLDRWLTRGGFLPARWAGNRPKVITHHTVKKLPE